MPPLEHRPDGTACYTLSSLLGDTDPVAPVRIVDSKAIAEYVNRKCPHRDPARSLFPAGTEALQELAHEHATDNVTSSMFGIGMKGYWNFQTDTMKERYKPRFERIFGDPGVLAKEIAEGWVKAKSGLEKVGRYLDKNNNGVDHQENLFFFGDNLSFVDVHIGAALVSLKICIGDQEMSRQLADCDGGRWLHFLDVVLQYV